MDINTVYNFIKFLADKDQQGNFTPKQFNETIYRALNEWVMKRYNNLNLPQPNQIGWQKNQKITDDLRFLLVRNKVSNVSPDGTLDLPDDYLHLSSIVYNYKYSDNGTTVVEPKDVDIVDDNEIASFRGSAIYGKRIKAKKYVIAAFYSSYLQFYPENINVVDLTYLRKPIAPLWAYTLENGRPVYDPVNSVALEAPDECVNEICMMCASYLSINLRDQEFTQYVEMQKQQGV